MITTMDRIRAGMQGQVLLGTPEAEPNAMELIDTLTPSAWAAQARGDRSVFTTAVALVLMNPRQRKWVLDGFEDGDLKYGDLEEADNKIKETRARYAMALATLDAAHDVLERLIEACAAERNRKAA